MKKLSLREISHLRVLDCGLPGHVVVGMLRRKLGPKFADYIRVTQAVVRAYLGKGPYVCYRAMSGREKRYVAVTLSRDIAECMATIHRRPYVAVFQVPLAAVMAVIGQKEFKMNVDGREMWVLERELQVDTTQVQQTAMYRPPVAILTTPYKEWFPHCAGDYEQRYRMYDEIEEETHGEIHRS